MSLSVEYYDVSGLTGEQISVEGTGTQSFSDPAYVVTGARGIAYAVAERGGWPLDGSRILMPEQPPGYVWSQQRSDAAGQLPQPVVLTFQLSEPVSTTGLTFTFWPAGGQWCSRVRVSWYNATVLLRQSLVYPDSARWVLQQTVEGFDKLRIELLDTNQPEQFAKLEKLELGQVWLFDEADLISAELVNEIDPMLSELTVDTMQVKVHVPDGVTLLPQENQRLVLYREDDPLATHYITGSSRESRNVYTLQAHSPIGLLEDQFLGGMYLGMRIDDLLKLILGTQPFVLEKGLLQTYLYGYLPVCTRREALQQVALAAGAVVTTMGDGVCRIRPVAQAVEGVFPAGDIFLGATVTTRPRYSRVEVAAHSYTRGEQLHVLLDQEPVYGTQMFTFDAPYHDYFLTGGQIVESDVNYICIEAQGLVTLQGREYLHTVQMYGKSDPRAVDMERENVLKVTDATLVTGRNAQAVLQQLYATAQLRQTMEMEAVIRGQKAGQKITAVTPWDSQTQGYITAMESRLTPKGQVASIKLVGMERPAQIACRYSGQIQSGDQEVLY